MNEKNIRNFANRDWSSQYEIDRKYLVAEYRHSGAAGMQRISQILWRHMKFVRPSWPGIKERSKDLDNHIALKKLLDRAGDALTSH